MESALLSTDYAFNPVLASFTQGIPASKGG